MHIFRTPGCSSDLFLGDVFPLLMMMKMMHLWSPCTKVWMCMSSLPLFIKEGLQMLHQSNLMEGAFYHRCYIMLICLYYHQPIHQGFAKCMVPLGNIQSIWHKTAQQKIDTSLVLVSLLHRFSVIVFDGLY